ncbi:MAG: MmgE/PrpD family protein [Lysobacterales bacterium]
MSAVLESNPQNNNVTADPTIAAQLAEFALGFDLAHAPKEVVDHAKHCILDACGIALASGTFDFAQKATQGIAALADTEGHYPVIGSDLTLPLRDAVLLNGILVHGLDFDDTHAGSIVHCTASAWPLALGAGLRASSSGADALAAYIMAVEMDARIGNLAQGRFQQRGHHPTGLVGAFGAAIAAGRLSELSLEQLTRAQGIVLSMAAGNLEFLSAGDWTKRMHPGWAGVCGLTAAALAKAGFLGPTTPYEGRYSLYNLHLGEGNDVTPTDMLTGLGDQWEILDVGFKPFPACHFNHAFADCAIALRNGHSLEPNDIQSVTALIHPKQMNVVCEPEAAKRRPTSSYEAQFSLHYLVAASLIRGRFTLEELTPGAYEDPETLALADRVSFRADPDSTYPQHYCGELEITLKNGEVLRHREAVNRGARENPISASAIKDKFMANATLAVSADHANDMAEMILNLDQTDSLKTVADVLRAR